MDEKVTETLLEALKLGLAEPGEQRLFRSGKLSGLFAGRAGVNAEASARALQDGLLEVARTEIKGKTTIEWVRVTPKGVDFVHQKESPVQVLKELRDVLRVTQEGVPAWMSKMQQDLWDLNKTLTDHVEKLNHRLEDLTQRFEDAIRRAEAAEGQMPNGVAATIPWAVDVLSYLDRRRSANVPGQCSLSELFAAVRQQHGDLSIVAFHEGLRRLYDRNALRLLPFAGPPSQLPEPEYALLQGADVLYYAAR